MGARNSNGAVLVLLSVLQMTGDATKKAFEALESTGHKSRWHAKCKTCVRWETSIGSDKPERTLTFSTDNSGFIIMEGEKSCLNTEAAPSAYLLDDQHHACTATGAKTSILLSFACLPISILCAGSASSPCRRTAGNKVHR